MLQNAASQFDVSGKNLVRRLSTDPSGGPGLLWRAPPQRESIAFSAYACCLLIAVFKNDTKLDMSRCCWSKTKRLSFTMEQNGLARCFSFVYFHIQSSGKVLETSKLKTQPRKECYNVRNYQLNTPHYFIYRNNWADLMYSSIKPAHDP